MKDKKQINILDIELFLLSIFGIYHVWIAFINLLLQGKWHTPGIIMVYWTLFMILLTDRMTYRKITNLFFWKAIFVGGICIVIIKNISLYPILSSIPYTNLKDIFFNTWPLLAVNAATILFIYRSYYYISKGV